MTSHAILLPEGLVEVAERSFQDSAATEIESSAVGPLRASISRPPLAVLSSRPTDVDPAPHVPYTRRASSRSARASRGSADHRSSVSTINRHSVDDSRLPSVAFGNGSFGAGRRSPHRFRPANDRADSSDSGSRFGVPQIDRRDFGALHETPSRLGDIDEESAVGPHEAFDRSGSNAFRRMSHALANAFAPPIRPSVVSIQQTYSKAEKQHQRMQRSVLRQRLFQVSIYVLLAAFIYLVLVGRPLWGGTVWYIYVLFEYHLTFVGGSAIFVGLAFFYAFGPFLILFDKPEPEHDEVPAGPPAYQESREKPLFPPAPFVRVFEDDLEKGSRHSASGPTYPKGAKSTALLIPCYKSAQILPATLEAALHVFPPENIFILNNSRAPTPPDDTPAVCASYGVNHIYIPIGSKLVAQYVGAQVIRSTHKYCLAIDDDCLLPPNMPIVTHMFSETVGCVGYTLKSVGPNRSPGTWCQQAQDLEYKLSGLQRQFAGVIGSATFPHGAIVLWETKLLLQTFKEHPGFSISEDWFFGHVARQIGSRIKMCSSVFIETETPSHFAFAPSGAARGGFGEMTVFKQRFARWNFFFVNGCYYNLAYIFCSWKLGFWEFGTKLFVFQEVYETFLYLITPIVFPISLIVRPLYTTYLFAGTMALYLANSAIFNAIHLRRSKQQVSWTMLFLYYIPFKLALTFVNVASCWWNMIKYAKYFSQRHLKVVDDPQAVGVVLKLAEEKRSKSEDARVAQMQQQIASRPGFQALEAEGYGDMIATAQPRRLTVATVEVGVAQHSDDLRLENTGTSISGHDQSYSEALAEDADMPSNVTFAREGSLRVSAFTHLDRWVPSWSRTSSDRSQRPRPGRYHSDDDDDRVAPDDAGRVRVSVEQRRYVRRNATR